MTAERFVVLGLAPVRSAWFTELGRWSSSALVPVDFLKCVSAEELRARLTDGRAISAVLLDGGLRAVDRDLVDEARAAGSPVIVIEDARIDRAWTALGATAVLPEAFERGQLIDVLRRHARPVGQVDRLPVLDPGSSEALEWIGHMIAVTGSGGTGTSTMAISLAQGIASDPRHGGFVALIDLAQHADLALLHDVPDVLPGIQEIAEAHRAGTPSAEELERLLFEDPARGYRLAIGLRRHRDWTALRPRAFRAALGSLRRAHHTVVADADGDLEGEHETGSTDVEDRNLMARTALLDADVVAVVGQPGLAGIHHLVHRCLEVIDHGVAAPRIVPVVNRSPRSPRTRSVINRSLAQLMGDGNRLCNPVHVPERRAVEGAVHDGAPMPAAIVQPLSSAVISRLQETPRDESPPTAIPERIAPGSLGHWAEEAG